MKIGVILSGCGVFDGSEIHEAVLTLLAVSKHGAEAVCLAPNADQADVINHLTRKPMNEKRNVLVESARIARGMVRDIAQANASEVDAVILPGGYGAVKNLCTFAVDGEDCQVHPDTARFLKEVHAAGKPIGAICIAPALVARIFQGAKVKVTVGNDPATSKAIQKMGQEHVVCRVQETCVDAPQKVVTTPAYMLAKNIGEAWEGIEKLVGQVLELIEK